MRLKELRLTTGLNQTQIAEKLGISRVSYNKYENEEVEPSIDTMKHIADFYKISLDYLTEHELVRPQIYDGLSDTKRKCIEDIQKMSDAEVEAISHYIDGMLGREFYKKETI